MTSNLATLKPGFLLERQEPEDVGLPPLPPQACYQGTGSEAAWPGLEPALTWDAGVTGHDQTHSASPSRDILETICICFSPFLYKWRCSRFVCRSRVVPKRQPCLHHCLLSPVVMNQDLGHEPAHHQVGVRAAVHCCTGSRWGALPAGLCGG